MCARLARNGLARAHSGAVARCSESIFARGFVSARRWPPTNVRRLIARFVSARRANDICAEHARARKWTRLPLGLCASDSRARPLAESAHSKSESESESTPLQVRDSAPTPARVAITSPPPPPPLRRSFPAARKGGKLYRPRKGLSPVSVGVAATAAAPRKRTRCALRALNATQRRPETDRRCKAAAAAAACGRVSERASERRPPETLNPMPPPPLARSFFTRAERAAHRCDGYVHYSPSVYATVM